MAVRHIVGYLLHTIPAWSVHLFTSTGALLGLLALYAVSYGNLVLAFWLLAISIGVDAVDGSFARKVRVQERTPGFDGALLDNIIDFQNYVIVPGFMLLKGTFLPELWVLPVTAVVVVSSSYQFCQSEAKTDDHFFRGFPSYWSIVVFYMFILETHPVLNGLLLVLFSVLSFVPIKFVYPSRMEFLTKSRFLRTGMLALTVLWGMASALLLYFYPMRPAWLVTFAVLYMVLYWAVSIRKTLSEKHRAVART